MTLNCVSMYQLHRVLVLLQVHTYLNEAFEYQKSPKTILTVWSLLKSLLGATTSEILCQALLPKLLTGTILHRRNVCPC